MSVDLVIKNGLVVDGTGGPARHADVAVTGGRITAVGTVSTTAARTIDAEGMVVSPGFIDGHTHMDAQVLWDGLGVNSCWHGVTTAIMGNTGFTLAPAGEAGKALVVRNLERAEDIPGDAMTQGIDWQWETFADYLGAVDARPKGINYVANVGHSALRTFTMGERAFDGPAEPDEVAAMVREVGSALSAGAVGLSTSRSTAHLTSDDRPVASRLATWDELVALTAAVGRAGGMLEIAHEPDSVDPDPEVRRRYRARLLDLALSSGAPVTFGVLKADASPGTWHEMLDLFDETAAAGGTMFGQAHSREISTLLSFQTRLPFDHLAVWKELRAEPLGRQLALLGDPEMVARLVESAQAGHYAEAVGAEIRPPDYERIFVFERPVGPNPTLADLGARWGCHPVEALIRQAVASNLACFFAQVLTSLDAEASLAILRHPHTVMTFSDSGAHVSQIADASIHTHLLAWWVRERQALTLEDAVFRITGKLAASWGLAGRGRVAEGCIADLNVFDPRTVAPLLPTVRHDLPGGSARLDLRSEGIAATVVAGEVLVRDGEHTGAMPGRLLRRRGATVS